MIFHEAISIFYKDFSSISVLGKTGWKLLYAYVERSHEPEVLSTGLLNCSGTHYKQYSSVVSCNFVQECQGNIDEIGTVIVLTPRIFPLSLCLLL